MGCLKTIETQRENRIYFVVTLLLHNMFSDLKFKIYSHGRSSSPSSSATSKYAGTSADATANAMSSASTGTGTATSGPSSADREHHQTRIKDFHEDCVDLMRYTFHVRHRRIGARILQSDQ